MRVRPASLLAALVVAALLPLTASTAGAAPSGGGGSFIVTLDDAVDARGVAADYRRSGAKVTYVYASALNGFAGSMSDANLRQLRSDRRVVRVERDGVAEASTEQANATWGLDRVDQASGRDGTYTYDHNGSGVTAYIIDTGIHYSHSDFGGRASFGYDAFGGNGSDCNGHGTHVAGTVAGTSWGIAKAANLVSVRVLDCSGSGTWSGVIAGLDWVAASAAKPAVANMSLGGGASSSVDDAVNRTIAAGVSVVVAAGNGNRGGKEQDACGYSPARVPAALTIGATTSSDAKTSWSNYGTCVDFFAPGASITSAWHTSTTATNTISGTSMSAPHVAGVAALYLQQALTATPDVVSGALAAATTKDIVTASNTANNDLLFSLVTAVPATTGTLAGKITSAADGTAIEGALVSAAGFTAFSDLHGNYSLTLPVGTHTATASATGFVTDSAPVEIVEGQTTSTSFALAVDTTPAPEAVEIGLTLTKGEKNKNLTPVTATWTDSGGIEGHTYDVWANGSVRATVTGDTHTINWRGSGTVTYRICRAGTTTCSPDVSIVV